MTSPRRLFAAVIFTCLVPIMLSAPSAGSPLLRETTANADADQLTAEHRLAANLGRAALHLLLGQSEELTVDQLRASVILIEEAMRLAPDDADITRQAVAIASLAEDDALYEEALERLVQIDPSDDVARLKHISAQLRSIHTAEELASAMQELIDDRQRTSPVVASRLAMELALLERRRGDTDRFAQALAASLAMDSANQAAAALAAGYFQMHVDDPVDEGELLLGLVLANPIDIESQVLFAAHLLGHGAYAGAERFYSLAVVSHRPAGMYAVPDLVADAAIAQLGRGDAAGALRRLGTYQQEANLQLQRQLQRTQPNLTPLQRAEHIALLTPTFATVHTAITHRLGMDMEPAMDLVMQTYQRAIEEKRADTEMEDAALRIALLQLEKAWVLLWLGGPLEEAQRALDAARAQVELSEHAEARFRGWEKLRAGDVAGAIDILHAHAEEDVPAQLGYAMALVEDGRRRDGGRQLLAVARAQPGTLIGVFAADMLTELLGQRIPLTDNAAALEDLAAKAPTRLEHFATDPTTALSLRVIPERTTHRPYEPLRLALEITNNSPLPLAIDPAGPIRPEIAIAPSIQIAGEFSGALTTVIVGIDRRLRLMPRERMLIPIDLGRTPVGEVVEEYPLIGAIVRLRTMMNFRASPDGALVPGLLGSETAPLSLRVDGVRVTPQWLEQTIDRIASAHDDSQLPDLALLVHGLLDLSREDLSEDVENMRSHAEQRFAEVFAQLHSPAQAWLLSVLPVETGENRVQRLIEPARYSEDRLVQLAWLLYRVQQPNDPFLDEVRRGGDVNLTQLADVIQKTLPPDGADSFLQLGGLALPRND